MLKKIAFTALILASQACLAGDKFADRANEIVPLRSYINLKGLPNALVARLELQNSSIASNELLELGRHWALSKYYYEHVLHLGIYPGKEHLNSIVVMPETVNKLVVQIKAYHAQYPDQ